MKKVLILALLLVLTGFSCERPMPSQEYNWSTMDEGPYKDKISYATSTDLLHWTDSEVVLAEHGSVPGALYKDEIIYVYFTDVSEDGKSEQIGFIKSEDQASTWSEKEILNIEGKDDDIVPVDLTPFETDDGKIRLYYFDINDKDLNKIYSAISDDGLNFTQEEGVRLEHNIEIFDPEVIKVKDVYYMYVGDNEGMRVLVATSSDGLDFEYQGVAYEGAAIPDAIYENDQFYLYTGGIEIAFSEDGLNYEETNYFFKSNIGEVTADPGVIKMGENNYLMVYKTSVEPIPRKMFEENK